MGKWRETTQVWTNYPPLPPKFSSNGGVICESPEILILIERKLGVRRVYLLFKGFRFGCQGIGPDPISISKFSSQF